MQNHPRISTVLVVFVAIGLTARTASAAAFVFAGETYGVDVVTYPMGYAGTGGTLSISLGIDPTSAHATDMVISTQNAIYTWNGLSPTTGNLFLGAANNIPTGHVDFESTLLHEMGHALGLAHPNLASESGLSGADRNYTKSTDGANNVYNINAGADGVIGSSDDLRGDDVNLNYFPVANNNPFASLPATIDSTTFSRDTSNLPGGHNYAANGDRDVAALLGYADTESVMQQGAFYDEAQRTLTAEDVAGIRYAMSGLDETQGTADDYTLLLTYAGLTTAADIVIDFDDSMAGFAATWISGSSIDATHWHITSAPIYFNTGYAWFFNDVMLIPEPSSVAALLGMGITGLIGYRWRRKKRAA
jgi:hypothetical protein